MIIGHLTQRGVILQRSRVRASIHRVDPVNTVWRDVHRCVTSLFRIVMFQLLEKENVLECLNDVDMFCLHYAFLEHINDSFGIHLWNPGIITPSPEKLI